MGLRHFIEMTAKNKRFGYVKEMTGPGADQ